LPVKVLLADDHAVVRDGLKMIHKAQGDFVVVAEASDGITAFRTAQRLRPDVVVLDIMMSGMNGIEAAREIAAHCPETRVVILSAYSGREHVSRALQAGVRGYVLKESAGSEVVDAIRTAAAGGRYLSRGISEAILDDYTDLCREGDRGDPLGSLSAREREILQLVVEGRSSADIAELLCLSEKTVESYRSRTMRKLSVENVTGLVKFAIRRGIVPLE
jgi:two-component system, NarL family, response regulator NreC